MARKALKAEYRELDIDQLKVNDYNANEMSPKAYRKLVDEIKDSGFLSGVLAYPEDDGYVVIDGEHRLLAGREAGRKRIPAFVLNRKPTRSEAIKLTIKMNALRGEWDRGRLRENLDELIGLDEEGTDDLREDLAGLEAGLDKALKAMDSAGLDESTQADMEAIEREIKLSERVKELIKKALIEGRGSIVKNYMIILDPKTGREMYFAFENQGEPVRKALERERERNGGAADGFGLERICEGYLGHAQTEGENDVK